MEDETPQVGFKKPPVKTRFQEGQSGNPEGRPRRKPSFFADASEILGSNVTGTANQKSVTLPMLQVMFRALCRDALRGDRQALQRVFELQLTLVPLAEAQSSTLKAEGKEARLKLAKALGLDPERIDWTPPKKKTPEQKAEDRRIARLVEKRRKELERGDKA